MAFLIFGLYMREDMDTIASELQPALSICIPTFGRTTELVNTVRRVLAIACSSDQVIVVDQNTPPLLQRAIGLTELTADARLNVVNHLPANLPAARNVAVQNAHRSVVLFIDDDVLLPSYFLDEHRRLYSDPTVDVVAGTFVTMGTEASGIALDALKSGISIEFDPVDLIGVPGGNFSVKTSVVHELGGFDENFLGPALFEDVDFACRCRLAGRTVVHSKSAWLVHLRVPSGGCRMSGSAFPEWQKPLGVLILAIRHGDRLDAKLMWLWRALRVGPLRKDVVKRPWLWPWAWSHFSYSLFQGWHRGRGPVKSPLR